MREIEVGIRFDQHGGLMFFGTEEINTLLQRNARIIAIDPGGAIMQKLGSDAGNVQLTLCGLSLKVKVEDP